ncbi:MAG TPA: hypothetical protein VNO83_13410 [Pseudonocardia sp.]|nr:hypothetical protein [Pseudonocardia sp.]
MTGSLTAEPRQEPAGAPEPAPAPRTRRLLGTTSLLVGCLAVATGSLATPAMLGFDPWVWLIWGREAVHGRLATDGTVAWKPLPVLVTALLAPFGSAAPALWTVLARAGGLFGLILVFRLAARFTGPAGRFGAPAAGLVAVAAFLLTPDTEARWVRHLLQGNIEPVTVALCLWAVERHLDGRRGQAVLLGCAACLTRPEAWPMFLIYAGWVLWQGPRRWWLVLPALAAVPLLWFGGDRLVSGSPLGGANAARVLLGTGNQRLLLGLDAVANTVIAPVWMAAAVGLVWAAHRRRAAPVLLAAAAVVWMAEVAVMSGLFGYAALGRFLAPAAAVLCILTGVAVGWLLHAPRRTTLRVGLAVVLAAGTLPAALPRLGWLPAQFAAAAERAAYESDLDRMLARIGRDRIVSCGLPSSMDTARPAVEFRPALAWKLDLPLSGVGYVLVNGVGMTFAQRDSILDRYLQTLPPAEADPVLRTDRWIAYKQRCPMTPG